VSLFDISESKTLTKPPEEYNTPSPALSAARHIQPRTGVMPIVGERFKAVVARSENWFDARRKISERVLDGKTMTLSNVRYDEEHYFEKALAALSNILHPLYPGQDIKTRRDAFRAYVHSLPSLEANSRARHNAMSRLLRARRLSYIALASEDAALFLDAERATLRRILRKEQRGTLQTYFKPAGRPCALCLATVMPAQEKDLCARGRGAMFARPDGEIFCAKCLDAGNAERYLRELRAWLDECTSVFDKAMEVTAKLMQEDEVFSSLLKDQALTAPVALGILPESSPLYWELTEARQNLVETRARAHGFPADAQACNELYGFDLPVKSAPHGCREDEDRVEWVDDVDEFEENGEMWRAAEGTV